MLHSDRIVALKLKKAIVNYHNCQTYPLVYFPAQGSSSPAQGFADAQGSSLPAQGFADAQGSSLPAQGFADAQGSSLPAQGSADAQGFADAQGLSATIVDALPSDIFAKEVLVKVVAPAIVKIEATAKVAM